MQDLLVRVDERLLHGQVLLGWAGSLQPQVLLLANDLIAEDPAQRRLIERLELEGGSVRIQTVRQAGQDLARHPEQARHTLVVVVSPADASDLRRAGAPLQHLNLGGLYEAPGRRRWLDYVWLSDGDIDTLVDLIREGVVVEARDLPATASNRVTEESLQQLRHAV